MTISQYYRAFGALGGIATGALAALPVVSRLLPGEISGYAFPPLGDLDSFARLATVAFALITTYAIYLIRTSSMGFKRRFALILWVVAFLGCVLYMAASTRFTRIIHIPTLKDSVAVSVGFERSSLAKALGDASDYDLLRLRGPQEEEIQRLWTFNSLLLSRLGLWASYTVIISAFVAIFCLGALEHATQTG